MSTRDWVITGILLYLAVQLPVGIILGKTIRRHYRKEGEP